MTLTSTALRAVTTYPGELPAALIDALLEHSDYNVLVALTQRPELTFRHTTQLWDKHTQANRGIPSELVQAHARACGAGPDLDDFLQRLAEQALQAWKTPYPRNDHLKQALGALSRAQVTYLASVSSNPLMPALVADSRLEYSTRDERLAAIERSFELLGDDFVPRVLQVALCDAIYDLRDESAWHGERAICAATNAETIDPSYLTDARLTDAELAHLVPLALLRDLGTYEDSWLLDVIEKHGSRMSAGALDIVEGHPQVSAEVRAAVAAARAARSATTVFHAHWESLPGQGTPVTAWLGALGPLSTAAWSTALALLDQIGEGLQAVTIADTTRAVLATPGT